MTERNENSAFVPVPETGTVVPTSGPARYCHYPDCECDRNEIERCTFPSKNDRIRELEAALAKAVGERDEARNAIAWANNSLFGSQGFFLSLSGGPADEHHLDRAIEDLKTRARKAYRLEAKLREALEALQPFTSIWVTQTGKEWSHARTVAQSIEQELKP